MWTKGLLKVRKDVVKVRNKGGISDDMGINGDYVHIEKSVKENVDALIKAEEAFYDSLGVKNVSDEDNIIKKNI